MKKTLVSISGGVILSLLLSSCASIVNGKTQYINLQSKEEQEVIINGETYTSPSIVAIKRDKKPLNIHVNECEKDILVDSKVSVAFIGNAVAGGILGSTTDASTGAMWEYDKTNINVDCN